AWHQQSRAVRANSGAPRSGAPVFRALFAVERRVDLGHFLGLDRVARLAAIGRLVRQLRRTAEVEAEAREAVAVLAGLDLLERGEQLLLGLRPLVRGHRHLVGRADVDLPVALEARGRRDQLPDD